MWSSLDLTSASGLRHPPQTAREDGRDGAHAASGRSGSPSLPGAWAVRLPAASGWATKSLDRTVTRTTIAPAKATGDGSGRFEVNAMYVTGKVTSVAVNGDTAVLHGTAKVTGLGAGHDLPFTATVRAGGPGTTVTLEISGLTFHEILLEGHITIGGS